ncbi:hypothetical protein GCM10009854_29340 [Saccharopolyspora halophila]|uniref:HTH hxlR-type domain-containing protein n=1 Tax=Saccharopolyspora halophila TaxID=405551 RepID=A0ABP5TEY6_9PSEU
MLIRHLQELVADGVIDRDDAEAVPPHVTYSVNEHGRTLMPVVQALWDWWQPPRTARPDQPGSKRTDPSDDLAEEQLLK